MDILEYLNGRVGQAQEDRLPAELARDFARVEDRNAAELHDYLARLAPGVPFFVPQADDVVADGNWSGLLSAGLPADRTGNTPPHLGLLAAFLKLYRVPRTAMNGFTARHLEFFYERVLDFIRRPPRADRAHLVVELKKGAAPVEIGPQHTFSGGKDAAGVELVYGATGRTVINQAKVAALCSVNVDPAAGGSVRFAPQAASADGLGAALPAQEPKWPPFGVPRDFEIPRAPIGFAVAAPVLSMKEGTRRVTLRLELASLPAELAGSALAARLEAFATGATRWLGPYDLQATSSGAVLSLVFTVDAGDEAVSNYDATVHGHAFAAGAPVVQVLLRSDVPHGYQLLKPLIVRAVDVSVRVEGVKTLQLESDLGTLDPRRAFQPFGPQPVPGSRFLIGCPEALGKKLASLSLEMHWLGLPGDFATQYEGYSNPPTQDGVKVQVAMQDAGGWQTSASEKHALFEGLSDGVSRLDFSPTGSGPSRGGAWGGATQVRTTHMQALSTGSSAWLKQAAYREYLRMPVFGFATAAAPQNRPGFITLKLATDLGHAEYRSKLLQRTPLAHEPYTPTVGELSLSYDAASGRADLETASEAAFVATELGFFHVGCYGQRREHAYLRSQFDFVDDSRVPLFPTYPDEGELLIGLSGIGAGDGTSLLFEVSQGSADPEADAPVVGWAVLCDNHFKPLAGGDAVRDGTDNLLSSGLVSITLPGEATTSNSFLPAGLLWIKASVRRQPGAVCSLLQVAANAIEVQRLAGGDSAGREWTALPAGRIAKLKTPLASVKGVVQPFASFGGATAESPPALDTRASERLRHRGRCISAWDYERTVLGAFPEIRKAKCIQHCAGHGAWLDPGNVMVVVVPDLRNRNAIDPLQPRADAGTLSRIRQSLQARAPMGIGIQVRNPRYERVRADFRVRFREGFEFNYYARQLRRMLVVHLSPWTQDPGESIAFGNVVYKSALIDFVEEVDFVDYVTDFHMYHVRGGPQDSTDVNEARASTPDAILVSDASHDVADAHG
ncbi:MAG TPA: baseplate J/gp47 family protein [Burkholderiales bacterium]|nr:baseplate J/gp47 family protein [Burkholderiales bacterium]